MGSQGLQAQRGIEIEVTSWKSGHGSRGSLGGRNKQQVKGVWTALLQRPGNNLLMGRGEHPRGLPEEKP